MRRHVGLSSLERRSNQQASFDSLSHTISVASVADLSNQFEAFQTALRHFATKHRSRILQDASFRQAFNDMCAALDVDPLGGGAKKKGIWDFLGLKDWIYALAVQVADICLTAKETHGGLVKMSDVLRGVSKLRTGKEDSAQVSEADIVKAIKTLEPLGCGYSILDLYGEKYIRCVPHALDQDAVVILEACSQDPAKPFISHSDFVSYCTGRKNWTLARIEAAVHKAIVEDGLVWIDQSKNGINYWATSLVTFPSGSG